MPNYKYSHEHLMSPDPQKTADFYIKMFGAKTDRVEKLPSGEMTIFLDLNGTTIVISQKSQPPFGHDHFGIATDDIEATVKDLKEAGYKITVDITTLNPKTKIADFLGPDSVIVALVQE